jgi:plastocyanin
VTRSPFIVAGLLVALVATSCGSDAKNSASGSGSAKGAKTAVIKVSLTDEGCDPHEISAKAGPTTFEVDNSGADNVTEFEVLKGSSIVGEVENVTPGIPAKFSITLEAGSYTTNCTGGTKAKGTLEVAKSGTGETANSGARDKAVATYLAYVKSEPLLPQSPPATSPRPSPSSPAPGTTTNRSSPSPRASATSIPRSTPATVTCRRPSGAASTSSSSHCGRTTPPPAWPPLPPRW